MLVQNFRPGAIERMGLGEDVVRKLRPDIIFVSISGFGESGPYAHQRVYDSVIQALCGLCDIQTDNETGRPRMVRTIVPDKTTSLTAAQAITAALFARERTGEGQHVRLAMLDTMVAYLWPEASSPLTFLDDEQDPAAQQAGPDLIFRTADGHITAAAVSDAEWAGMCRAFGRDELIRDPRFNTAAARGHNRTARRAIMKREIARWPTAEILARLDRESVPAAPVLTRGQVIADAQVVENRIIEVREDPDLGPVRQPRPAARFTRTPAGIRSVAPWLGADNATILAELGYDEAAIARLVEDRWCIGGSRRSASPHFSPRSRPASRGTRAERTMRPGVRSARSGPKSVSGNTVEARDAAGGRLGATRRAALSGRQCASRRLPDAPHRAARRSYPVGRTAPRRP